MPGWFEVLLPVCAGFAVVLVSILVLRLHAFFALILAALVTAALTSSELLAWQEFERIQLTISSFDVDGHGYGSHDFRRVFLKSASPLADGAEGFIGMPEAEQLYIFRREPGRAPMMLQCQQIVYVGDPNTAFAWQYSDMAFQLPPDYQPRPGDMYVLESDFQRAAGNWVGTVGRVTNAFGNTVGSIGLIIAFAAVIGMCLLESGAADRIVRSALRLVGERGAPTGFAGCGFLLGIPVFFDTVFFLMIPLGKALRLRTGRNYILYILTIYCGATMAHSLVPPTPGPLLVAESLRVPVGLMMLVGLAVGLITAGYGIFHATIVNRYIEIPLRDTPEMPLARLEELAARADEDLPPLWLSLLPIILPVWLIGQQTAVALVRSNPPTFAAHDFLQNVPVGVFGLIDFLGEKNIALGVGVIVGLILLAWQTRATRSELRDRVGRALAAGGLVILITSAGGAFGSVLAETGIARMIQGLPDLGTAGLLTLAFLVTVTIRTVQGSATVAMITAVGLFVNVDLPFHAVWLALAIGCGSKPISWMNDSGFWVIGQMSGMTEIETLKTLTPMTIMMGVVGLLVVILGAMRFPLV